MICSLTSKCIKSDVSYRAIGKQCLNLGLLFPFLKNAQEEIENAWLDSDLAQCGSG